MSFNMTILNKKSNTIYIASKTDIGKKRESNEDSIATHISTHNDGYAIAVVADGMGGYDKGEIASEIAAQNFIKDIQDSFFEEVNEANISSEMQKSICKINERIYDISLEQKIQLGTTLIGAMLYNSKAYISNIGDSRAYLVKPNKLIKQISKDHSAVQEMIDAGIVSKEKARNHPRRNILTRSLGTTKSISIDFFEEKMKDEILLLCSDGLWDMLEDEDILKLIDSDLETSTKNLINAANDRGGIDNISVILCKFF